ncbi:hypothetical protein HK100_000391 [Physocladia obscura]|uniref:non-specific serine/threonine protein kinase n=1 Tax=Physocladia obscura TaxID=109957 RepID=A0AAD5XCJ6_9FUNG|nr:hypothetical protein HK100_000391 [Physocladia obscura]
MELFETLERIGRGSFGSVYRGRRKSNGQIVAIKVLDLDTDDEDIVDVQKEISVLSHIDNEYITRYHGSYLVGTKLWIVMDLAAGGSLRNLLKSGAIEERCIAIVAREVLFALVYLHKSVKIIHRDIKAANILLTDTGHVKLCDFGVAGHMLSAGARRNSFVGTPYWMGTQTQLAPEIITRSQYDFKADIWSLGITIIELATGNPPFANHDPRKAMFLIPRSRPAQLEGDFSPQIKEFIALCLTEEPEQRPSAEELLKTRFIKGAPAKGFSLIRDLIERHEAWKASNTGDQASILEEKELPEIVDAEEDAWNFDTFNSKRTSYLPSAGGLRASRVSRRSLRPPSKVVSPGSVLDFANEERLSTNILVTNEVDDPSRLLISDGDKEENNWAVRQSSKKMNIPNLDSVNDDYWLTVQFEAMTIPVEKDKGSPLSAFQNREESLLSTWKTDQSSSIAPGSKPSSLPDPTEPLFKEVRSNSLAMMMSPDPSFPAFAKMDRLNDRQSRSLEYDVRKQNIKNFFANSPSTSPKSSALSLKLLTKETVVSEFQEKSPELSSAPLLNVQSIQYKNVDGPSTGPRSSEERQLNIRYSGAPTLSQNQSLPNIAPRSSSIQQSTVVNATVSPLRRGVSLTKSSSTSSPQIIRRSRYDSTTTKSLPQSQNSKISESTTENGKLSLIVSPTVGSGTVTTATTKSAPAATAPLAAITPVSIDANPLIAANNVTTPLNTKITDVSSENSTHLSSATMATTKSSSAKIETLDIPKGNFRVSTPPSSLDVHEIMHRGSFAGFSNYSPTKILDQTPPKDGSLISNVVAEKVVTLRTLDFNMMKNDEDVHNEIMARCKETVYMLDIFEALFLEQE